MNWRLRHDRGLLCTVRINVRIKAHELDTDRMDLLRGLTLLLLCQAAGEVLARALRLPLPGPVVGLLVLLVLLRWPPLRQPVQAAAAPLLAHLSLLFVPVGVGVVAHAALVSQYGLRMLVVLVASTWVGLLVTAMVLRAAWGRASDQASGEPLPTTPNAPDGGA